MVWLQRIGTPSTFASWVFGTAGQRMQAPCHGAIFAEVLTMTSNIPENKARQGGLGRPVLVVLVGGLLLAAIAWGIAELYGEQAKTPATQQNDNAAASSGSNASSDRDQSKADDVNGEPVDQNPKVDKNPTPQSSTGGEQQGTQPTQPTSP
jgi:cytoskeletal protein RodZ